MNIEKTATPFTDLVNGPLKNDAFQYWALQIFGWSGYAFFVFLQAWIQDYLSVEHAAYLTMATLLGLLLTMAMRRSFLFIWHYPPVKRGLLTLLSVGIATGIWSQWKLYVSFSLGPSKSVENMFYESSYWYSYSLFILLSWTGLYYGIKYYKLVQKEHEKTLRAEAMAHQAQLKMLRYQLNPHFLFNTLNSVSTLIMDKQGDLANRMITELSRFLRYSLENDPMQKVSLDKELEAMHLYLDIEKIRFGERLHLEYDIDESTRPALIPSMLLQPLIENAIKYAIAVKEEGGTINISSKNESGTLVLRVCDNGPGMSSENGNHGSRVGLINIRERLSVLYGDNQSCEICNREPQGLEVRIRIPFESVEKEQIWKN